MSKISIIGAGAVGSACAYALSFEPWVSEMVLVDINESKAKGEALDIMHGVAYDQYVKVQAGSYEKTKDSDVVVITVGIPEVVGESRLIPLQKNADILSNIVPVILKNSPNAILLIVSNPVDLLTEITYRVAGTDSSRVIGLGTMLDTSRLRYLISEDFNVSTQSVSSLVVGEHGDSQVVLWSKTQVANMDIEEYAKLNSDVIVNNQYYKTLEDNVRKTAFDVWDMKGPNNLCVATAVKRVVQAIVRNENCVLPVSSRIAIPNTNEHVYASYPSIINRQGIAKTVNLHLNENESDRVLTSVKMIKELADQVVIGDSHE